MILKLVDKKNPKALKPTHFHDHSPIAALFDAFPGLQKLTMDMQDGEQRSIER